MSNHIREDHNQSRPRRPRPKPQEKGPLRFLVEARLVGALIGIKGSRIRAMETLLGAQIKIDLFNQAEDGEKPQKQRCKFSGVTTVELEQKNWSNVSSDGIPAPDAADEAQKAVAQMSIQEKK